MPSPHLAPALTETTAVIGGEQILFPLNGTVSTSSLRLILQGRTDRVTWSWIKIQGDVPDLDGNVENQTIALSDYLHAHLFRFIERCRLAAMKNDLRQLVEAKEQACEIVIPAYEQIGEHRHCDLAVALGVLTDFIRLLDVIFDAMVEGKTAILRLNEDRVCIQARTPDTPHCHFGPHRTGYAERREARSSAVESSAAHHFDIANIFRCHAESVGTELKVAQSQLVFCLNEEGLDRTALAEYMAR